MIHAIWSGMMSFGLVTIPVSLVSAIKSRRVAFNLLHRKDYRRLRREMYCPAHGQAIKPEHMIRGFEIEPERYITVTSEEMRNIAPKRSKTIEISSFVSVDDIDPVYYEVPYYLIPAGANRAYRLLQQTLREQRRAAIASFVLHDRQHLAAIRGIDELLCLFTMHYEQEVVAVGEASLGLDGTQAQAEDVEKLTKIIEEMGAEFNPERFAQRNSDRLRQLIANKESQGEVVQVGEAGQESEEETGDGAGDVVPDDFMKMLEESMAQANAVGGEQR